MTTEAGQEQDKQDLPQSIFGFPIVWTDEVPAGRIGLIELIEFTDWRSYVRFKLKEEEPEPEGSE
jgi:hypothetical protein